MKKSKLLKIIICIITIIVGSNNIVANAKTVKIERDNNPEGVTVLSARDVEYYIEIDEETKIGYVVFINRGIEEVIGTCNIVVYDRYNTLGYSLCEDENVSDTTFLGYMEIIIIDEENNAGYIAKMSGILNTIFTVHDEVYIHN